ncbi:MAG: mRNA surveillance protein pelota [Euryarchaeota archaeon]|nr:mRNA surveillance protein pelota [Euryarchaeota archaeon]
MELKIEEIREDEKYLRLLITNIDDLWFLSNFIEKDDIVLGTTFRKSEDRSDSIRSKKGERIRIEVGIEVEDLEFQEFTDRLRIRGKIKIGPEEYIGHYQSLNFSPGDEIEIIKREISKKMIEELERSEKRSSQALFISIDDESATLALLRDYGIQVLAEIRLSRQSKEMEGEETNYDEVIKKVLQYWNENMPIFVIGPGFFKENFIKRIEDQRIKKSIITLDTSYAGEKGIYEALRSGALEKIMKDFRVGEEVKLVSLFLEEIGKEGKYAYGIEETKKYAEMGAVDTLLILDTKIKDDDFRRVMDIVEENGGNVKIISSHHEYGKILKNFGGIGAILRYKV